MKIVSMAYGQALFDLDISTESIHESECILNENPELMKALENPLISKKEKNKVIEKIFPGAMQKFLKTICANRNTENLKEAFAYYHILRSKKEKKIQAELIYVTKPEEIQKKRIKKYLKKKYDADSVELILKQDHSLIGGFVIKVQDYVIDNSLKGKLEKMKQDLTWR
ncbi:ATP synthase F1 subunit delta [Anaerostipes faecalis]|uniref:ATP synthase F1 subunit delta n=1 Tax=Anaerostipes faecalis TaxID=2738446 RepID=UPI001E427ED3|nr:ATP synthase F1 subunit delta [Anaerostipes faecalis]